jgi:hypothetical protein
VINSYYEIVNHSGFDFEDYLRQMSLVSIFEPVFQEYPDKELAKKVVRYIAYSHSMESNKLSVGGDRRKELNAIFKDLDIPKEYYDDLVLLKNRSVIKSVQLWMQRQDNRQIEYLFTLQNAYVQQQTASLEPLRKTDGITIDYNQKMDCIEHMTELKKMIKDAESELQQNHEKLKESYQEVKKASKRNTISPIDYVN